MYYKVASSQLPAPRLPRVLIKLYYKVASSQLPAPQIAPRTKVVLESRQCLHFAHSTRTISAEGCARTGQIALSPAFRALDTHDLRKRLRADRTNRALTCILRTRQARSPQRVARGPPVFRALDTHDLRRGLHFRLTLFVPPSAFKREFIKWEMFFIRTSPVQVFHTHTCILALGLHWDTCILLHLDTYTCILTLGCFLPLHWDTYRRVCVQVSVWKRQCSSVSVEMSVFKGFSGRTLRNAFGKNKYITSTQVAKSSTPCHCHDCHERKRSTHEASGLIAIQSHNALRYKELAQLHVGRASVWGWVEVMSNYSNHPGDAASVIKPPCCKHVSHTLTPRGLRPLVAC